jgi:hypothetical protein
MKGMIFTEFMTMVEDRFGLQTLDTVITESNLSNDGAYSAIGTYDHQELIRMVVSLSKLTETGAQDLVRAFGTYLFVRFVEKYPVFFRRPTDTFSFLETVEETVHVEVLKLAPDAELPSFQHERLDADNMTMVYRSKRCFADLAEGLMEGCAAHFGDKIAISREDLPTSGADSGSGSHVLFKIERVPLA